VIEEVHLEGREKRCEIRVLRWISVTQVERLENGEKWFSTASNGETGIRKLKVWV
jgi:hypothetical protein